nr:MAG TPA: hypothetical protein [Caudoviricetes sp.]
MDNLPVPFANCAEALKSLSIISKTTTRRFPGNK